jgi:hypothetical protein
LYSSPNIARAMKSRRMRWVEHVACLEEIRNYIIFVREPERRELDVKILLKCILNE